MAEFTDALPPPIKCDNCQSTRVKLYQNRKRKQTKYVCKTCKASVYCHKGTNIPLGYMANAHTRYLRAKAHEAFDPLWLHRLTTRDSAYKWAARQLSVPVEHAHIGRLSDANLERLAVKSVRYYRKLKAKAERKKAAQDAKNRRQRIAGNCGRKGKPRHGRPTSRTR